MFGDGCLVKDASWNTNAQIILGVFLFPFFEGVASQGEVGVV